ncbi:MULTISPECIES: N-acetylmuramoyl-L-alanine amidase CwlD [Paenibacillus]|uniref:N-acetylmuramoyl-L-alanine amidase CwlD n=1 Tax=Paenibacillus oceani TaxID=2772510 RepID=A0A927CGN4_9BACL|nr:N-acetylmuramoyl-L-alanine amidase CwlD [Paenibacillus oceani]MBD2866303.1 N-acetylmuramoyl-L-alanine amidase CwlD [Paenibacillus oceani]MDF2657273.1 germination-specific N-acetylmuramoyl-L-alanine amidase [Paenibacillus sp.]
MRRRRASIVVWLNLNGKLKLIMSSALVILMIFLFTYELPTSRTWSYWTMPLSGKVIAIDAGHGGPDGGASSSAGLVEKEVNLAISLYLRDYLQQSGAVVVMTREDDRDLANDATRGYSKRKTEDLHNRVALIENAKADILVSVHLNSIPSAKWKGAQTFYNSANEEGKKLAGFIQSEIRTNLSNTDRVPKTENTFYLLKALTIPGALVEVGFLSNPEEARLMADAKYQRKVAESIYRGILRYVTE